MKITGWAEPGEAITIDLQATRYKSVADSSGRWSVRVGPYPAGGPYEMTITGKNRVSIKDLLIGDVWLASGQSNMQVPPSAIEDWGWKGIPHADELVALADAPKVRLVRIPLVVSSVPQDDFSERVTWQAATPQSVREFSAIAYLFGRRLNEHLDVPIGIIQATVGGTAAEAWMSAEALQGFPEFAGKIASLKQASAQSRANYQDFLLRSAHWYQQHGNEDRGQIDEHPLWADPQLDVSDWPTLDLPPSMDACRDQFGNFNAVMWFRRTLVVSSDHAGRDGVLRLGNLYADDVTYFNGRRIGSTRGWATSRNYLVPAKYIHAGENTIAVRAVGSQRANALCTGMISQLPGAKDFLVDSASISLAGSWSYQAGADLKDFPTLDAATRGAQPGANTPTVLFNGMIRPLIDSNLKGIIWYQGESNAVDRRAAQYRKLFPALIDDWRRQWGYTVPFLFVQLAGFGYNDDTLLGSQWPDLRDAQRAALSIPLTGMASAIDLGEEDDIHPRNKQEVARRLALVAAGVAYGENVVFSGPVYAIAERNKHGNIRIRFANPGTKLVVKDKYGYVRGFELAGPDGKFMLSQARLHGSSEIVVLNNSGIVPTAVRYGWSNTPDGNVFNEQGLPALPFQATVP